jgi:PIN domain nuclease of toxin-antitoxin system
MMSYLLDSHAFIWTLSAPEKISARARNILEDPRNEVFVSSVSLWEIAIKIRSKRLAPIGSSTSGMIEAAESMGFLPISLTPVEAATHGDLTEDTHFDPFDRMLIWQAISRNLTLVSGDAQFRRFIPDGLKLIW